jgi:4-amino-4-deoxy-L-arabinose transferase-like glycosyltransferase
MTIDRTRSYRLAFVSVLLSSSWIIFYRLGDLLWTACDESYTSYCVNSVLKSHNWLYNFDAEGFSYGGAKPPLFIWCEVLMAKAFGFNEWSLRALPALAGVVTIMVVFDFVYKETGAVVQASVCAVVLLTTQGYVNHHVTRSGDFDSLLTLFTTLYVIYFYRYLRTGRRRSLWYFNLFLALGVLTKSTEALLFLPCLAVFVMINPRKGLFGLKEIAVSACIFLLIVVPYYVVKEIALPGYIHYALGFELIGRFAGSGDFNARYWTSAYKLIVTGRYLPWILFYLLSVYYLFRKNRVGHPFFEEGGFLLLRYSFFLSATWFFVLCFSNTQFSWYLAPFYPIAAIATGITVTELFSRYRGFMPGFLLTACLLYGAVLYKFYYRNAGHYKVAASLFGQAMRAPAAYQLKFYTGNLNWVQLFYQDRAAFNNRPVERVSLSDLKTGDLFLYDDYLQPRIDSACGKPQTAIACWEGNCMIRVAK